MVITLGRGSYCREPTIGHSESLRGAAPTQRRTRLALKWFRIEGSLVLRSLDFECGSNLDFGGLGFNANGRQCQSFRSWQ